MESTIIIGLGLFMVATFFLLLFVFLKSRKKGFASDTQKYITSHWFRIIDSFDRDFKVSVMEADKLLDYAMGKRLKVSGVPCGEKLKKCKGIISNYDGIWHAHKLRNRIAHELSVKVDRHDAKRALSAFKSALLDLGATLK